MAYGKAVGVSFGLRQVALQHPKAYSSARISVMLEAEPDNKLNMRVRFPLPFATWTWTGSPVSLDQKDTLHPYVVNKLEDKASEFTVIDLAHQQIAAQLQIPFKYYQKILDLLKYFTIKPIVP